MFNDIFSKKTTRNNNKPKPKIIADIHEKDSMILAELKSNPNIDLFIQHLKIGDYQIGETIIERKTSGDFVSSMLNKRLIEQLNQMKVYENKLLIIEGDCKNFYKTINPHAIRGFILSIINNHKIPIIFTKDYKDTSDYLIILSRHQLKPMAEISLHQKIPKTIEEKKRYILEAFPNIGPKTSEKLLKKFPNLKSIFNSDEADLKEILKSNAKLFRELLDK